MRHDVRRVAAVRDDAVDARVLLDVLAHRVDAGEEFDDAVEGVRAVVGIAGGVRGLAVEHEVDVRDGEAGAAGILRRGAGERPGVVDHQRGVHVLEDAGVDQFHLAAAALFGRACR